MPQKIRMWEVAEHKSLNELPKSEISLEERLEDWLESDISLLDENLMVIGRQVRTDFGGKIDLLCIDRTGSLVVIEVKKSKTPRRVTSQALEYASWVKDLDRGSIEELVSAYPKLDGSLKEEFESKFEIDLPEALNLSHRSLIVAEAMDDSTERIVGYLSEMKVPINVATVQHFRDSQGREFLAQSFLVEPEIADVRGHEGSKGQRLPTKFEMETEADERRIGQLYGKICYEVSSFLKTKVMRRFTLAFVTRIDYRDLTLFVVDLDQSDDNIGLRFRLNGIRSMNYFNISQDYLTGILPDHFEKMDSHEIRGVLEEERSNWVGFKGYFKSAEDVQNFVDGLRSSRQ